MTLRIVLADDHAVVREGLRSLLSAIDGYALVGTAATGAEAIRAAVTLRPDVLVMDIQMPDMNGIEVIVQLRAFAPHLPVIAMSGGGQSRDLDLLSDAKLLGAVGVLYKPFTGEALTQAITAALQHTQRRNE